MRKSKIPIKPFLLTAILFFIAQFIYFAIFNRYHLAYQEQIQLFRFDWDYFAPFLAKPGGISEYLGTFFIQFYLIPPVGPLIVTLAGIITFILTGFILKKAGITGIIWSLIPVLILAALQSDHVYYIGHTTGYILSLSLVALYVTINKDFLRFSAGLSGLILLYPVTGGFSLVALLLMIIFELFFKTGRQRWLASSLFIFLTVIYLFILWNYVYLIPLSSDWLMPLLFISNLPTKYWLIILFLFMPLVMITTGIWFRLSGKKEVSLTWNIWTIVAGAVVFLIFSAGIARFAYDYKSELLLGLDYNIQKGNTDKALWLSARTPGSNRLVVYLTNLALAKSGKMGDQLFHFYQVGPQGLLLDWGDDAAPFFGSELFYQLGYINEAYRWAFEALVAKGHSPRILKRLALTSIINGQVKVAGKYLDILEQTLFYSKWAKRYKRYLGESEGLVADNEINDKRNLLIHNDFFADVNNFDTVLGKLLENHPDNRNAFEYLMSSLLLDKNLESFAQNIYRLEDLGYTEIPLHYEEALLVHMTNSETNIVPENFSIRESSRQRFNDYIKTYASYTGNPDNVALFLSRRFGKTYWYYLQFR